MKNLILILTFLGIISPKVWGNDFANFNINSFYTVKVYEMNYIDNLYTDHCIKNEQSFNLSESVSFTKKSECYTDNLHERSFMLNYHINKKDKSFALTYNTLSIGVAFDTKKIDLGNGHYVTQYKPRVKADLSGNINPGYFFTDWKITVNSTSAQKMQERYLPVDPIMKEMLQDNLFRHSLDGSSLKGRVIFLELRLSFNL